MSAEQELRDVNEERLAAVKAGDLEKLDEVLSVDLISVSPAGTVLGKAEMMSDLKSGNFKIQSFAADDYKISLHGDTGIVAFRNTMAHSYRGTERSGQYRVTSAYLKRQGRWILVAQHVTHLAQQPYPG